MGLMQEESFPRGGKKAPKRKLENNGEKRIGNLFSTGNNVVKRKKRDRKPRDENRNALPSADSKMEVKSVDLLSYEKILDGNLVLGCVHSIHSMTAQIGLPGRIFGDMTVKHISKAYLDHVSKLIEENNTEELVNTDIAKLFKIGQYLPVKVLLKEGNDRGYKLYVSTDPKDINSEYKHNMFEKGMLLWAAISERSDHGYILDAGVKNCRIVLPFTAINENVTYLIGQPIWCSIRKCEVSKEATTLTVSTKEQEVSNSLIEDNFSLSKLIPGMQVEFEIQKKAKNGLVGIILNNVVAHVNELYLKNPLDNCGKYQEDTVIKARVLYIEPITKFVKLTLREINSCNKPILTVGSIQTATILANVGRGLSIKLGKHCKGFVTYKRILNTIPKQKDNSDIGELIEKKYPIGSNHQCRILCYNYMEMEYICTFEASIIKEKVFSANDLEYGRILQAKITKIQDDGIEIRIGNVTGFVPNMQVCNTQFSSNIKMKFKVGQSVKTKLFEKAKNSNRFTLKQALIDSGLCLSSYEDCKVKKQYPGVIVKKTKAGALILFYGGVKGWLPCKEGREGSFNPAMFFEGQVVLTTIVKVEKNNRITLSLDPPKQSDDDSGIEDQPSKKRKRKKNKAKKNEEATKVESNKAVEENKNSKQAKATNENLNKKDETNKKSKKEKVVDKSESEEDDESSELEAEHSEDEEMEVDNDENEEIDNSELESNDSDEENSNLDEESDSDEENENSDIEINNSGLEMDNSDLENNSEENSNSDIEMNDSNVESSNSDENSNNSTENVEEDDQTIKMPGMQSFFNVSNDSVEEEPIKAEQDLEIKNKKEKKVKLKPEEVRRKLLEDEERLIQTELKLASETNLQTPQEIEKALISDPHNSKLWVLYIATLTSSGEIDKGRGICKKALETIPFEKTAERFNIWVAYLNLENSFGNTESFDEVFAEATNRNDALKIHLVTIEILREAKKLDKMAEIIRATKRKFKQNPDVYLKLAKTYYLCGKFHDARQMQGIAVKYVSKKKEQVDLLVQFAILEFKHGDTDYAESVFETILQTDPTRVDVWCTYADQLVNKKKIDFARKIFTRAANTKLALKKTKTILTRFHKFEKEHGTPKTLDDFKTLCSKFAETL